MPEINYDGGGVDMHTDRCSSAMSALRTTAQGWTAAWGAIDQEVKSLEGSLGKGPMGESFVSGYEPNARKVKEQSKGIGEDLLNYADLGDACVRDYLQADTESAANFPGR